VRHGAEGAAVELRAYDASIDLSTELSVRLVRLVSRGGGHTTRRVASADGKVVRSGADFYGRVRAVLFTPEDLGVLRGSPSGRRQFLDRVIFARDRTHIGDVQRYEKLLRSRNHVLRRMDAGTAGRGDLLSTYEAGLAEVGARIWTRRTALLEHLQAPFGAVFANIHGQAGPVPEIEASPGVTQPHRASLQYAAKLEQAGSAAEREARLLDALRASRAEDERRGSTSVGPHRDDFVIELDGRSAGDFASQGQARALVLAFKLAELQAARQSTGTAPLLLLDDVSSELDPRRTELLFSALARDAGQCVLTTTAPHFIRLPASADARLWHVERGRVTPEVGA
jgi:DNA replication and repair protein RecF